MTMMMMISGVGGQWVRNSKGVQVRGRMRWSSLLATPFKKFITAFLHTFHMDALKVVVVVAAAALVMYVYEICRVMDGQSHSALYRTFMVMRWQLIQEHLTSSAKLKTSLYQFLWSASTELGSRIC